MERSLLIRATSSLSNRRYASVPSLQLPANTDNPRRSLPASPIQSSVLPTHEPFPVLLEGEELDRDLLQMFSLLRNKVSSPDADSIPDDQDLMDINVDDELSVLDLFDPYKQSRYSSEPEETLPDLFLLDTLFLTPSSPSFTYPIKLQLKLSTCSEMKPFVQLVQRIRNEYQSKESSTDQIFYCKRVRRLTSQHIEQNQLPVTLFIFTDQSKQPIRLTKVSLQSTVAHILNELLEILPFDYDQSILKLRAYEEYLRNDDVLCDIEYVHRCINSLKPLQFVLVKKPVSRFSQTRDDLTFVQFSFECYEDYFQMIKQRKLTNFSNRSKQMNSPDQTRWFIPSDSRWLEDFRRNLDQILEQIGRCFNTLIDQDLPLNQQFQLIEHLINYSKTIQIICSEIRSPSMLNKQRELKNFKTQLTKQSESEDLIQLFWDVILTIVKYIQTYSQAFFIPYEVEIYDNENVPINIEQFLSSSIKRLTNACSIGDSLGKLSVRIDNLSSLPLNIKTVCILVRLCYGNEIKAKEMTRLLPCVRNRYSKNSLQVRVNQKLAFNDVYLCGLPRETLLLFDIYATFLDEIDGPFESEVFEGIPMRRIGWCSQALFDHEHYLITGERFLGILDSAAVERTGFYSLRNVFDHECSVLTISFSDRAVYWPDIQARDDMQGQNFMEISRENQEYLCRLLDQPSLLLVDYSTMMTKEHSADYRKQPLGMNNTDEEFEFPNNQYQFLWSYRHYLTHKSHALPKLLKSRSVWDYPSLIDIYGLLHLTNHDRRIDGIESFELLLPAFPDMYIRSFASRSLISQMTSDDLRIYLPQLLQIIKFDYNFSSPIIEYLLQKSIEDHRLAHQFYWHLRQLLLTESIHFMRYYFLFISLLYVIGENFRIELQNEYDLCLNLKRIGSELKTIRTNRGAFLNEQLKDLNQQFFQSGKKSCRLPCQFNFLTNNIDLRSCSIFNSMTVPVKLVFNPIDSSGEKYSSIYKIGDDLRQDQIVLQLLSCMEKIWQANDFHFRLSLFNVVQTHERCGFIEMVTESETILDIEKPLGTIKGSFGESALYDWLRLHNTTEFDFRIALDNLTYSCAGYCVATYVLGIGDRHNENIMVKKSGQLFHIDFGKYLGETQKFGWFNRDRAPIIFTKQMLYAMSDGGTSNDAMHRFVDLCCNAFHTLRENSALLLLLLSHLCTSNVPNLNHGAVRYVYDRLALSMNYAESITHFTNLISDSLNSTWIQWNSLIHKLAQTTSLNSSISVIPIGPTLSFIPKTYTIFTDGKIHSAQVVNYEKRSQPSKRYFYKIQVERVQVSYHYRTYQEFYEFYERLNGQFPLIGLDLKNSRQTEDKILAQRHASDINDFLGHLFRVSSEIIESDLVCTFFHTIQRDQQINDVIERNQRELSPRSSLNSTTKIRIQLKYENGKLFVMVRHANNLPMKNGNEPKPYCKCYLFPDEFKSTKRKGKVVYSRNPIFNDTFIYEFDLAEIQKRVLRVSIWNNILTVGNRVLGEIDIVLSQIDWSKENACDYPLATLDSFFVYISMSRYPQIMTEVLSLRFNQDSSCFVCATNDGIRVFNLEPFAQKCYLDLGRVTYAEMLYRTNLIAYVPAEHENGLASNVVNVYDHQRKAHVLELCFNTSVASIRMSRTRLLVVLVNKILVFSFPNQCQLLHTIETRENPKGLCELSNHDGSLLAFPLNSKVKGGFIQLLVSIPLL